MTQFQDYVILVRRTIKFCLTDHGYSQYFNFSTFYRPVLIFLRSCIFFMTVFIYESVELFLTMYTTYGGNYLKIQESAENYLETILMLSEKQPYVRSIDIATELGFSKPSVSVAMKNLRVNNLILVNDEGHITLTDEGRRIAETIYERHTALSKWLMDLGVNEQTALDDACRIEHDISAESFAAIKEHIKKYSSEAKK